MHGSYQSRSKQLNCGVPLSFDSLRLTTMTLIVVHNGVIDIMCAFLTLPVVEYPLQVGPTQRIPFLGRPKEIYSVRFFGRTRGLLRGKRKKNTKCLKHAVTVDLSSIHKSTNYFKHAVTVDLSISHKNINAKLAPSKIQICGAKSMTDGREVADILMSNLLAIDDIMVSMNEHKEEAQAALEWITVHCRGQPTTRTIVNVYHLCRTDTKVIVYEEMPDHDITTPPLPDVCEPMLSYISFFLGMIPGTRYYSDYITGVKVVLSRERLIHIQPGPCRVLRSMVNYNYSLGYAIDRIALNNAINGLNGFSSFYLPDLKKQVTVELLYNVEGDDEIAPKKPKDKPRHTFLVYKPGAVTQSGPGGPKMKAAFDLFIRTMEEIKPLIAL
jgi:hypothetical protein